MHNTTDLRNKGNGTPNDNGKKEEKDSHSHQPQRQRKTAITLSLITCLFMGIIGYEINRESPEKIVDESSQNLSLNTNKNFFPSSLMISEGVENPLAHQIQLQSIEIKQLKKELYETQHKLRNQMLTQFPTKYSSDRTKLELAGELISAKEEMIDDLNEQIKQLEKQNLYHQEKLGDLEYSYKMATELADSHREKKDYTERLYREKIHAHHLAAEEKNEQLFRDLLLLEEIHWHSIADFEEKKETISKLQGEINYLGQLLKKTQNQMEEYQSKTAFDFANFEFEQALAKKIHEEKESQIHSLEGLLSDLQLQRKELNQKIDTQMHLLAVREFESKSLLSALDSMKIKAENDLSKANIANEILTNKVHSLETQVESPHRLIEEKKALESEILSLLLQKEASEKNFYQAASFNAMNEHLIGHLASTVEEKLNAIAALKNEVNHYQGLIALKEEEIEDLNRGFSSKELATKNDLSSFQQELSREKKQVKELEEKLFLTVASYEESQERLKELEAILPTYQKQLEEAKELVKTYSSENEKQDSYHREKIGLLEEELATWKNKNFLNESLENDLLNAQKEREEMAKSSELERATLQATVSNLENEILHYQNLLNAQKHEMEKMDHAYLEQKQNLYDRIQQLTINIEQEKEISNKLQKELFSLLTTYQKGYDKSSEEFQATKEQVNALNDEIMLHQFIITTKEQEMANLENTHRTAILKKENELENLKLSHQGELEKIIQHHSQREKDLAERFELLKFEHELANKISPKFDEERFKVSESELNDLKDKYSKMDQELTLHQFALTTKDHEIVSLGEAHQQEKNKLSEKLKMTLDELLDEKNKIAELDNKLHAIEEKSLSEQLNLFLLAHELKSINDELKHRLETFENDTQGYRNQLREKEKEISLLTELHDKEKNSRLENVETLTQKLQKEIRQGEDLSLMLKVNEQKFLEALNTIATLEWQISQLQEEVAKNQQTLAQSEDIVNERIAQHQNLEDRNLDLEAQIEEYQYIVKSLRLEILEQQSLLEKMEGLNAQLSQEFEDMRRDYLQLIEKNSTPLSSNEEGL